MIAKRTFPPTDSSPGTSVQQTRLRYALFETNFIADSLSVLP